MTDDEVRTPAPGRARQSEIFRAGASGSRPAVPTGWSALVASAERAMTPEAWAYVAGSAGRESTAEANYDAFDSWRLVPRMLRDVAERDLSIELFGRRHPTPLLTCPIGVLELVDPDADRAIARAAGSLGITSMVSCQASLPMEAVAGEAAGPWWFQLYWSSEDALVESLVARAEAAGAEAIVVTLDTGMLGWRPRDLDRGFLPFIHGMGIAQYTSDPVFRQLVRERMRRPSGGPRPRVTPTAVRTLVGMTRRHPGRFRENLRSGEPRTAVETFLDVFSRPSLSWGDLPFLRERTRLPILLKGVQHPDDARRARDAGVDGIVVSTHGGRQVDGAIGALDALPGVVAAVGDALPVILDSGVRGGADVVRALALGATAVGIGRAWVYGLAIAGEEGARQVLRDIVAETDLTLGLTGHRGVAELSPDDLVRI
ncbi:alpha-hydroxy-acid oxidizing protein [Protaetiibacter mangrovi]|uniref:Alpha-hydroxy-acid oxidizing protein n=1 Tax=Protaetiibacter mangrovi TaxID=2970926 RepID=A0ABT1ZCA3_9MICO|nr:alpha-hydroxy-acid oxidizing protein [Protaetiibacter mangrovi]MCS0498341.1 alpha-hydroxy-acid oxidizing protein [Protaetiibacter mangrovi]TPX05396.1 lactate 2-monooxygenase [Schumannella luteola]